MSGPFEASLRAFADKVEERNRALHLKSTETVLESMTVGSPLTGAPGQPVDTSALLNSYPAAAEHLEPWVWQTTSDLDYAEIIEEGEGPPQVSPVGGPHSLKMTRAGWQNIVDHCAAEVSRD